MFDYAPLFISLRAAVLSGIFVFILGTAAARLCLNIRGKLLVLVDVIFTLPMVLPPTVLGFFLLVLFGKNSPVGMLFAKAGVSLIFSWQATVIAAVVVSFPLMYKGAKGALEQVNEDHVWAARTLGMSETAIFLYPYHAARSMAGYPRRSCTEFCPIARRIRRDACWTNRFRPSITS